MTIQMPEQSPEPTIALCAFLWGGGSRAIVRAAH